MCGSHVVASRFLGELIEMSSWHLSSLCVGKTNRTKSVRTCTYPFVKDIDVYEKRHVLIMLLKVYVHHWTCECKNWENEASKRVSRTSAQTKLYTDWVIALIERTNLVNRRTKRTLMLKIFWKILVGSVKAEVAPAISNTIRATVNKVLAITDLALARLE